MAQLYTLLKDIKAYSDDSNDLATLVGYSIIKGLMDSYQGWENITSDGARTEQEFNDIRSVHKGLEKVVEYCSNNDCYNALCELQLKVDPFIKDSNSLEESSLLFHIAGTLRDKGDYIDRIRKKGLRLFDRVKERGELTGTRNILTLDYKMIGEYFAEDRRR